MSQLLLTCQNVKKTFRVGTQDVTVLSDASLEIAQGDFVVIFGPSGCGKSTLLHILLGLESPTFGKVIMNGQDIYRSLDEDGRAVMRKKKIGMVYQQPNWVKSLTVLDNVAFPLVLNGIDHFEARRLAMQQLDKLGMGAWASYRPGELSSGQQQKVALARGVSTNPELIIADEPTGNLDYKSGVELMEILTALNKQGKTIVMVTHDLDYLNYASVAVEMFDGKIINSYTKGHISTLLSRIKK